MAHTVRVVSPVLLGHSVRKGCPDRLDLKVLLGRKGIQGRLVPQARKVPRVPEGRKVRRGGAEVDANGAVGPAHSWLGYSRRHDYGGYRVHRTTR